MIKKYWLEIVVFGLLFLLLTMCCAPAMTYINTNSDGAHYLYSAKYLYPAHKTSAPLYLLLAHGVLQIQVGNEFWRMAMISVFATLIASFFIYLIVRKYNRHSALIAAVVYAGSALVISQSTIVESYPLVTMFGVGAYYFAENKRWLPCALMLGCGAAIHMLIGITALVLLISYRSLRNWKYLLAMASFGVFYLYIPLTNRAPYIWQPDPSLGSVGGGIFKDIKDTIVQLVGSISQYDVPKRIFDTALILLVSLGVAVIPIVLFFRKVRLSREPLFWLIILPIILFATNLAPQTYVYMLPSIAFGAVVFGRYVSTINPKWAYAVPIALMSLLNFVSFDIGRAIDPQMSAQYYYDKELPKVPDGAILMCANSFEWPMIYKYNEEQSRHIIPVCAGMLLSQDYRNQLARDYGVKTPPDDLSLTIGERQVASTYQFAEMNKNVWITYPIDARSYVMGVRQYRTGMLPQTMTVSQPKWRFMPSNPYDFITGAIEIEEWNDIILSNRSALFYFCLAVIGGVPAWFVYQLMSGKKWRWENVREKTRTAIKG